MHSTLRDSDIVRIREDVYLVSGSNTNWVVVKEGDSATLIDSGYPADYERLLASLAAIGLSPGDVSALLVTHAHNDHIGAAERLRALHGIPVFMHEDEVAHARRDFLQQVSAGQVLRQVWRPGVLLWAVHTLRAGGTYHVPVLSPRPFPVAGSLDLPGAPIPVHTPGHTLGHCAYHLPASGIVVSGDALVTGHPTSRISGPQLLPDMFHADRERALTSLVALAGIDADVVVPGHGPVHYGSVQEASTQALQRAEPHAVFG
jgi:glyoxylase-like metal-dependent hydrolase (beta-lactamase superfamily II)